MNKVKSFTLPISVWHLRQYIIKNKKQVNHWTSWKKQNDLSMKLVRNFNHLSQLLLKTAVCVHKCLILKLTLQMSEAKNWNTDKLSETNSCREEKQSSRNMTKFKLTYNKIWPTLWFSGFKVTACSVVWLFLWMATQTKLIWVIHETVN